MEQLTRYQVKRYYDSLTEKGKLQSLIFSLCGTDEDKQFLVDCIIEYNKNYPKMPKVVVNGR